MKNVDENVTAHRFLEKFPLEYTPLLASCATTEHFVAGEQIFQWGDNAEYFYLIIRGSVDVEMPYPQGGRMVKVQTLGPNEALGWSWLYPPYRWHFAARAAEPTSAIVFSAEELRKKAKENPVFGYELATRVGRVVFERLQSTRKRLLEAFEVTS